MPMSDGKRRRDHANALAVIAREENFKMIRLQIEI